MNDQPAFKCPMTGYDCTCVPRTEGHWCCWSIPKDKLMTPEELAALASTSASTK